VPSSVQFHKNIRLPESDYRGQQFHFITICCHERRRTFLDPARCKWLLDILRTEAPTRNFAVHAYCVMPDHFHFLAEGTSVSSDLLRFMKSFKIKSSRLYQRQTQQILWQKKFFDHILRPREPA